MEVKGSSISILRLLLLPLLLTTLSESFLCISSVAQQNSIETSRDSSGSQNAAKNPNDETPKASEPEKPAEKKKKKQSRGSIVVAPLPISSPAIGSGIVPIAGYIFPLRTKDTVSPPSVIGGAGLITNNGSAGFALGADLYMRQDTYQITTGFARGNINYDIYGTGIASGLKLPLNQTGHVFSIELLRRIGWKFFLGPAFLYGQSIITINPKETSPIPIPPDAGLHTTLSSLGIRLKRDTSLNRFYPTGGTFFDFTANFFSQGLGSKYSFQSYRTTFNKYWGFGKKQVLAYNGYACATGGTPPFYGNCVYGTNNELRGYTAGRYFTSYMLATQLEYRLVLPWRFGVVAFGGIGETIPGDNQTYGTQHFLPAGGGGVRYMLSKKFHVNLRADAARGRDGHTFGLGVGEAF
jgi:Omp85 superfamily domain